MVGSVQILSNLNYPISKVINEGLRNSLSTHIAVAFLKYSGVEVIQDALIDSLEKGAEFEIIVGLDFKTTDSKSIRFLLDLNKTYKKLKFYCYGDKENNKTDIVFHPKIYMFDNGREKTSIIDSTNLTRGGLESNFEVNTIFTEKKPLYYSQLNAIYNSIKYADSLFTPNEEYLQNYDEVFSAIIQNEQKVSKDKSIQEKIKKIEKQEKLLPGTIPSIKAMIVEFIFDCEEKGVKQVALQDIYQALEERIKKEEWGERYKSDTFRNTIRGELNHHVLKDNPLKDNLGLFERLEKGFYALTPKGRLYQGR
ncbi:phospholipase D-like domain-containing protein [Helicobacter pylori]